MRYPESLLPAVLLRRYKRFLADVRLPDGTELTVHCANPGAMTGCAGEGWPALISRSPNPGRKLSHTLELVHNGTCWIGVNPGRANDAVDQALQAGSLPGLEGYAAIRREAVLPSGSRVDFLLEGSRGRCYLEVKSVTLLAADGRYAFPDAVTARGLRHIGDLEAARADGHRAVLLFLIQRTDGNGEFRAASEVDPAYAAALVRASRLGVEVMPVLAEAGPEGIRTAGMARWTEGRQAAPGPAKSGQFQKPGGRIRKS
jgi:sugar fermentation stimulation protein A